MLYTLESFMCLPKSKASIFVSKIQTIIKLMYSII